MLGDMYSSFEVSVGKYYQNMDLFREIIGRDGYKH
jgi:hypothetical protein